MTVAEKSFQFALNIIALYKRLKEQQEFIISKQILRSGTSIGANIEEGSAGQSKKDFLTKIAIASKEVRETRYRLRLLDQSHLTNVDVKKYLYEIEEIVKMLTKIVKTTSENIKNPST